MPRLVKLALVGGPLDGAQLTMRDNCQIVDAKEFLRMFVAQESEHDKEKYRTPSNVKYELAEVIKGHPKLYHENLNQRW